MRMHVPVRNPRVDRHVGEKLYTMRVFVCRCQQRGLKRVREQRAAARQTLVRRNEHVLLSPPLRNLMGVCQSSALDPRRGQLHTAG